MPPLLADLIYTRACKPICEKLLTLPNKCDKKGYRLAFRTGIIFGISIKVAKIETTAR